MQTRDANGAPSCGGGVSVGMYAWVRPWAKYADGTLTFYYGEKSSLGTGEYELNSGTFEPEWYKYHKTDITKVVFNESFKDARPETGYKWFAGMENLENIENLQNLNTSEMTYMRLMFWNCSKIQSLDLSNFNTAKVKDMEAMFLECSDLQSIKLSSFNTEKVWTMERMFYGCKKLQSLDLSNFNTEEVKNMYSMFEDCFILQSLDLSSFNTKKVNKMLRMFFNCNKLVSIYASNLFTTDNVSEYDSRQMFLYCDSLSGDIAYDQNHVDKTYAKIDGGYFRDKAYANRPWAKYADGTLTFQCGYKRVIDNSNGEYELNTGANQPGWYEKYSYITKVVFDESFKDARPTTGYMWFYNCYKLTGIENISYLNTSEMTNMEKMFGRCSKLESLDLSNFNTEKVETMRYMFDSCSMFESLDLSNFNTAKVTNMSSMFNDCSKLQSLDLSNFNTAKVTDMRYMFYDCSNLQSINLSNFNAAMVTDMRYMFYYCSNLQSINLSNFNTEKVTNMSNMFSDCSNLKSLDLSIFNTEMVETMRAMFSDCPKLQSLDLSNFNTEKVTDMSYMFNNCSKLQSLIISKDFTTKSMKSDTYMFVQCPAKLYTPMADYMARSDNKKIYTKIIKPFFPINAKAEYGTLCSPVGGTLGEGTFYGFDKLYEVDADKTDDTKVVMKEVTEIEAGKPYVYRRNLTDKDPVANAIIFKIDKTAASAPQNPGMLKGTFESMIAPGGSYILQTDGMFHRVNDSNATLKVGAYRAYLDLSSLGSEAKAISMSFDDSETTGIREVNTADSSDTPIYDLTGRRINKPQRGQIYIQNGKKRVANF